MMQNFKVPGFDNDFVESAPFADALIPLIREWGVKNNC